MSDLILPSPKPVSKWAQYQGGQIGIPRSYLDFIIANLVLHNFTPIGASLLMASWLYTLHKPTFNNLYGICSMEQRKDNIKREWKKVVALTLPPSSKEYVTIPREGLVNLIKSKPTQSDIICFCLATINTIRKDGTLRINITQLASERNLSRRGLHVAMQRLVKLGIFCKIYTPMPTVRAHGAKYYWKCLEGKEALIRAEMEKLRKFKHSSGGVLNNPELTDRIH